MVHRAVHRSRCRFAGGARAGAVDRPDGCPVHQSCTKHERRWDYLLAAFSVSVGVLRFFLVGPVGLEPTTR